MNSAEGFTHPEFLIETDALEPQLGDPALRVFDCTTNLIPDPKTTYQAVPARADFEKGQIPGAQFIDLQTDLSDNGRGVCLMMPAAPIGSQSRRQVPKDRSRALAPCQEQAFAG